MIKTNGNYINKDLKGESIKTKIYFLSFIQRFIQNMSTTHKSTGTSYIANLKVTVIITQTSNKKKIFQTPFFLKITQLYEKSRIRETLNLLTDADNRTNTKKNVELDFLNFLINFLFN